MREVISDTNRVDLNFCANNFAHVVSTYVNIFVVPVAQNSCSARGTELLWCQGHRLFMVPGAHVDHIATTAVFDPVRSAKS